MSLSAVMTVLLFVTVLCLSEASFESQCVVEDTEANFYCYNEGAWYINGGPPPIDGTVKFMISNETGERDDMQIIANQNYLQHYGNISLINCLEDNSKHLFATLIITTAAQPELEIFPMLMPETWTSLSLEWVSPNASYYGIPYYNYTITLTGTDNYFEVETVGVSGVEPPGISVELGGYECEQITIEISLPGNCEPARITATLLLEPPYPQPRKLKTELLNSTSFALTWKHPDNTFDDDYFNYSVNAMVVSTGEVIRHYVVSLSSTGTPWEEFDLSGRVEACQEIRFTLSLVGDCREIDTTAALPIYPQEFSSEVISVEDLFTAALSLQKIEIIFMPPSLCPTQMASYTLTFSNHDNGESWSTESTALRTPSEVVKDEIKPERFQLEKNYTVTVTIATVLGNVSSNAVFNLCTLFGRAPRELSMQSFGRNSAQLSWQHLCNTTSALSVTYVVTAVLVDTGVIIYDNRITLLPEESPSIPLNMEEYACRAVNYTVSLYGHGQTMSIVESFPAYPTSFDQDIEVDASFNDDGIFKEVEIAFMPPRLCEFQSSRYILSYSDGNETWSNDPMIITDTSQLVKDKIESGIEIDTDYTVTVTVIADFGNLSSNATFMRRMQTGATAATSGVPVYTVVGIVVAALVCGVIGGGIVLYCLRQGKRRREKLKAISVKRPGPMVLNPLYEAAEDHYEHLPDCNGLPPPSLAILPATPTFPSDPGQFYTDITPQLPPPRRDINPGYPGEKAVTVDVTEKSPKRPGSMHIPESKSLGGISNYSGEDCYTIMSPAGTLTMLPRNTSSNNSSEGANGLGAPASKSTKCVDDNISS